MASKIYPLGIDKILSSALSLEAEAVDEGMYVVLVKGTYSFNTAHDFYDDIAASIVDSEDPIILTNPEVTTSTAVVKLDADDTGLTWSGVTDADDVGGAVVYYNTGTAGTSPLIAFLDATDLTTNGSDVTLTFNASGIFTLNLA